MQPFEWSEKCSVGIPELDAQHRHLLELLGELLRHMQSGEGDGLSAAALKELNRYAESHLQREELVLRVRGYPGYAEHKAEHDAYRTKLASLQLRSERGDLGVRITNFVTEWWRFHVLASNTHASSEANRRKCKCLIGVPLRD
jgi:hemerythrin-like metal-binding protein